MPMPDLQTTWSEFSAPGTQVLICDLQQEKWPLDDSVERPANVSQDHLTVECAVDSGRRCARKR